MCNGRSPRPVTKLFGSVTNSATTPVPESNITALRRYKPGVWGVPGTVEGRIRMATRPADRGPRAPVSE